MSDWTDFDRGYWIGMGVATSCQLVLSLFFNWLLWRRDV